MSSRCHHFYALKVKATVHETDEAVSVAFALPEKWRDVFAYRAGQFVTLRVEVDGEAHLRSYSMSSSPHVDDDLQITVKRVPRGIVSNWLIDHVRPGDLLEVNAPSGSFVLEEGTSDIVAFVAGSGITPVFSIVKAILSTTGRRCRLLYANRDRKSTIFADALDKLAAQYPDRLYLECHFDEERGFVDGGTVTRFVGQSLDAEFFICGPTPFMDTVDGALMWNGVRRDNLHIERFTLPEQGPQAGEVDGIELTITLHGQTVSASHRATATLLHTARAAGLRAPSSCETGSCATCIALVVDGRAEMRHNGVLTADEIAEGWVLTCQAIPATPSVKIVYP